MTKLILGSKYKDLGYGGNWDLLIPEKANAFIQGGFITFAMLAAVTEEVLSAGQNMTKNYIIPAAQYSVNTVGQTFWSAVALFNTVNSIVPTKPHTKFPMVEVNWFCVTVQTSLREAAVTEVKEGWLLY